MVELKTFLAGQSQQRPPRELATTALPIGPPLCAFVYITPRELYLTTAGEKEVSSPFCARRN